MSGTVLHRGVIEFARLIYDPYLKKRFRYDFEKADYTKGNYIVLANHTTNLDSMFLGVAFARHMYFVAGEQLFRMGFVTWLLKTFLNPIIRMKAKTEARTAINMLRTLKQGHNIAMFPEGSCTWNGETSTIIQSTAKLVSKAGVALITYNIQGGYATMPRWSRYKRKGKMVGRLCHIYEPEQLEKMSVDEIYEAIKNDLYANNEQICKDTPFKGRNLAEYLETVLFVCPKCKGIATYTSKKDTFTCTCGVSLKMDEYCTLLPIDGSDFPYKTVLEWDTWQRQWVFDNIENFKKNTDNPITSDDKQKLFTYTDADKTTLVSKGSMTLYSDRLVFTDDKLKTDTVIMLQDMTDIAIITMTTLTFSCYDVHYEVKSKVPRSALKYLIFCKNLSDMRYII